MAKAKRKPCSFPPCRELTYDSYCDRHKKQGGRSRSRQGAERHKLYSRYGWRKISKRFLSDNPLCVECKRQGRDSLATVTDHIIPHRGDIGLFLDIGNYQALCKPCHDEKTARGE